MYLLDRPIKRWQNHYLARLYLLDHLSIKCIQPGTTGIHVVFTPKHSPSAQSTCYRMIGGHHATINLSKVSRDKSNANLSRYKAKVWLMLHRAQQCQVGLKNTQLCMAPGISCCRSVHSKVWWFTRFCDSHYVSHFAAFFINVRTKTSIAEIGKVGRRTIARPHHVNWLFRPIHEGVDKRPTSKQIRVKF